MKQDERLPAEEEIIAKCKLSPKTVKLLRDMSEETYKEIAREIIFLAKPIILAKADKYRLDRPKVICLCGSTRFTNEMLIKQWELTKQGFIVLSWCALPEEYFASLDKAHIGDQEGVKEIVDEVHFRKIDLADEVIILNIGGYIGESTRNELNYAIKTGKAITYLEEVNG